MVLVPVASAVKLVELPKATLPLLPNAGPPIHVQHGPDLPFFPFTLLRSAL